MPEPETPHPDARPHKLLTEVFGWVKHGIKKGVFRYGKYMKEDVLVCYQCVQQQSSQFQIHLERWLAPQSDNDGPNAARSPGKSWTLQGA